MNMRILSNALVSVGLLFATTAALAGSTTPPATSVNSPAHTDVICATCGDPGNGGGGTQEIHPTFFQTDHQSKTIKIQFSNGRMIEYDLAAGIVEVGAGNNKETYSLNNVLLQAANNDTQEAQQLESDLNAMVASSETDAKMAALQNGLTGINRGNTGSGSTNIINVPGGGFGGCGGLFSSCMWAMPIFDPWGGGYGAWWNGAAGGPGRQPSGTGPCGANDPACQIWEDRRQIACDNLSSDAMYMLGGATLAGGVCGLTAGMACPLAALGAAKLVDTYHSTLKTCESPYPY